VDIGASPAHQPFYTKLIDTPFMDEIIDTPLPPMWTGLTIKLYDGSTDPDEHLNVFKTQMTLYMIDTMLWCKVSPFSFRRDHSVGLPNSRPTPWRILKI